MKKYLIVFMSALLWLACTQKAVEDGGFEGSITYKITDAVLLDSAKRKELDNIIKDGSNTTWFKNGSMLCRNDEEAALMEYFYFSQPENVVYLKLRGQDSIYATHGEKDITNQKLLTTTHLESSDTVLGKVCKQLQFGFANREVTLSYSADIPANPDLYAKTKHANYGELYKYTRAYYLRYRQQERGAYSFEVTADKIEPGPVPDIIFPDVSNMPVKWLD